jgi:hypothetical protein
VNTPRHGPVRPVPRLVLLGASALVVVLLVAAIEAVDLLRHPPTGGEPPIAEVDADPRVTVPCPELENPEGANGGGVPVEEVTSGELYDCPGAWDGRRVRYYGEVVGAVLHRGSTAWVHLNDDVYAGTIGPLPAHRDYQGGNGGIGVRIPAALADEIAWVGSGRAHGDLLVVEGTFHRVHPESREPAVIVASSGDVVEAGRAFVDPVLPDRAVAALVLGLLALVLVTFERVVARRRR